MCKHQNRRKDVFFGVLSVCTDPFHSSYSAFDKLHFVVAPRSDDTVRVGICFEVSTTVPLKSSLWIISTCFLIVYQNLQSDIYIVGNWHAEAVKEFEEEEEEGEKKKIHLLRLHCLTI